MDDSLRVRGRGANRWAEPARLAMIACATLALGPGRCGADLLEFAAGGVARLPATIEGDAVLVEAPEGRYEFRRSDFRRVVTDGSPEWEWPAREREARAGDAAARFEAARWALDRGLVAQAAAMLRLAHEADPAHQPTARMVAALDRLEAPCPEPDLPPIRRALAGKFREARGPHVVLLHQHDDREAAQRVELLERVVIAFYLEFAALGLDLAAPPRKLPSAWFATRADYRAFLRAEHADAFLDTRGYHHPTRGLVVAYDARSDDDQIHARAAIAGRRDELAALSRRVARMPAGARLRLAVRGEPAQTLDRDGADAFLARLRRDTDRQILLAEQVRYRLDRGTAAHEMVHQLVAASRLAPRHEAFPAWLHEGLAMQFEAIRGGDWAGLGEPPALRSRDWRSLRPPPRLVPLLRDAGLGRGYRREPYAQAWGLVAYLRLRRPAEFVALLDRLRLPTGPGPGRDRADRTVDAARAVFGDDLAPLEAAWLRAMDEVATPPESPGPGEVATPEHRAAPDPEPRPG